MLGEVFQVECAAHHSSHPTFSANLLCCWLTGEGWCRLTLLGKLGAC